MSELYNKKELKKQSRDFRIISSRTLTSDFQMFGANLKRLINFIDNNEIIKNYIESCISEDDNFKIEEDVNQVCGCYNCIFDNYIDEQKEVSYIYQVLKYIVDNNKDCRAYTMSYSTSSQFQDKLKSFCDNVVEPLINHIDNNYERIFIEMGLDEDTKFEIINNGGQVNIAKDNATLNATQNNGIAEYEKILSELKKNINNSNIDENLKNDILENAEGIKEELTRDIPRKGILKSLSESLSQSVMLVPKVLEIGANISTIINFIQPFISQ